MLWTTAAKQSVYGIYVVWRNDDIGVEMQKPKKSQMPNAEGNSNNNRQFIQLDAFHTELLLQLFHQRIYFVITNAISVQNIFIWNVYEHFVSNSCKTTLEMRKASTAPRTKYSCWNCYTKL